MICLTQSFQCLEIAKTKEKPYMKKKIKKYLDIYSRGKSDKKLIFNVVTSSSMLDKYIFSKNTV